MIKNATTYLCGIVFILSLGLTVEAKVSPEKAARLGQDLTPLGAIKAGNAEGTIPAWEGGITKPIPEYKPGMHHPDPYSEDKPLFTINSENLEQYTDKLSPGQIAMFKRYPKTWKMKVYPTRRSAAFPEQVYESAIANATSAVLADKGNGVKNASSGVPFPIPNEGVEAIWNHIFKYRGETTHQVFMGAAPTAGGRYVLVRFIQDIIWPYHQAGATTESIGNRLNFFSQQITSPARRAGLKFLVHEPIDQVVEPRKAWVYNPGQRRVRRAPAIAYDNPGATADAQRTNDQTDMYNGTPNRYNWTLLGKREMYVPYNSYRLHSGDVSYDQILKVGHINPELLRYELHRVWVVDANLKEGTSHIYPRRTFLLDEDSWQILVVDQYDHQKEIWRVSEAHVINYYEVPLLWQTFEVHYDLQNGRYAVLGMNNEDRIDHLFNVKMDIKDFTPNALRRKGRR
jgi:hypothetical protein